jgi:hypothetical protein
MCTHVYVKSVHVIVSGVSLGVIIESSFLPALYSHDLLQLEYAVRPLLCTFSRSSFEKSYHLPLLIVAFLILKICFRERKTVTEFLELIIQLN